MRMKNIMKIVIRAGGIGTRLWPLSRVSNPKQFQTLVGDKSMIQTTIDRIQPLLQNKSDLFISINKTMAARLKKEVPKIKSANVIVEPSSRNTGPAICLEACFLASRFGEKAIVASLPSDDFISNSKAFCDLLKIVEKFLEDNPDYIVTPGVRSLTPDTGYSYIKGGKRLTKKGKEEIFAVEDWIEKPNAEYCKELIASGKYYCHTGMYLWRLKTILDLFRKFQPKMYEVCMKMAKGRGIAEYAALEKISIEAAITSKASKIAMSVSNQIGWSDLGKWHVIKDILPSNEGDNLVRGKTLLLDTTDSLVWGPKGKLIVTIGLDDMIIVDSGDALLVCPKERAEEVKDIIEALKKRGDEQYL